MVDFKNKLSSWLLAVAIFLAPLNLFLRWSENKAYINGIFSDYLIPKIWLAEIPIIVLLGLWLIGSIDKKQLGIFLKDKIFIFLLAIFFLRQFFTHNYLISIVASLRLIEFGLLFLFLKTNLKKLNQKIIYASLAIGFLSQILLANSQFFLQKNIFPYRISGETQLAGSINIAKVNFKTGQFISPYGSMAHPNILAGFLVVMTIILINKLKIEQKQQAYFGWLMIALISWTLFITQSYAAIVGMVIFLVLQTFSQLKNKLSLWLFLFIAIAIPTSLSSVNFSADYLSIHRRIWLSQQGLQIWWDQFIFGTGLNNFLYHLKTNSAETIRFIQPTHHSLLLWLAETGLIGTGIITYFRNWLKQPKILEMLFVLLPIISLDHYLMTQWLGGWLLITMVLL